MPQIYIFSSVQCVWFGISTGLLFLPYSNSAFPSATGYITKLISDKNKTYFSTSCINKIKIITQENCLQIQKYANKYGLIKLKIAENDF